MSSETMLNYLQNCSPEGRIGFHVASQCAPVLKDCKVANMISTSCGQWRQIRGFLKGSSVVCIPLVLGEHKDVLLLYRYERMVKLLSETKVRQFLRKYGYELLDLPDVIKRLRLRYRAYAQEGVEFPHELGVLLDYPVEDVESYIMNDGKNSLMTRYWKVYHNLSHAKERFRSFDEAKEMALAQIVAGSSLQQVAV